MSIWDIKETDKVLCFVEAPGITQTYYQAWDIINFMSDDYKRCNVQLPTVACWGAYENCLAWWK